MTGTELDLSRELTRVVRATAGVHDVYATGGLLAVAVGAVTGRADDEARVAVDGESVNASIAVAPGFSAPDTLRAVTTDIAAYLATIGEETRRISVTASRIE